MNERICSYCLHCKCYCRSTYLYVCSKIFDNLPFLFCIMLCLFFRHLSKDGIERCKDGVSAMSVDALTKRALDVSTCNAIYFFIFLRKDFRVSNDKENKNANCVIGFDMFSSIMLMISCYSVLLLAMHIGNFHTCSMKNLSKFVNYFLTHFQYEGTRRAVLKCW